jgi:pimeloyl-ACP methyl ester carboxylesterase
MGPTPTPHPTARPTTEPSDTGHIERGQITSQALANNLVGDPAIRDFMVYLPPSYDTSDRRYPVVYILHGFKGDQWEILSPAFTLDEMLVNGETEEMILVSVDGSNRFGGSWYLSSPTIGDYEKYIVHELVDHIDANYRTLPSRDSRGIMGCSMGGEGSLRLALKYPDVFSVAVPISGLFIGERHPAWKNLSSGTPEDFDDLNKLASMVQSIIALSAAAASNPDRPPFYLDMPFEKIDGETQIVQEVYDKVNAVYPVNYLEAYLDQPNRLRGLLIVAGEYDSIHPTEVVRDFEKMLGDLGIEHEYLEVPEKGHCNFDITQVLQYMSNHLAFD